MSMRVRFIGRRVLRAAVLLAAFGSDAFAQAAASAPAQIPLVSRVASPPPPNVMITIDDSGSMQAQFMPEGSAKVNGVTVPMPTLALMADLIDVFYGDRQERIYSGIQLPRGISLAVPGGDNVFQRQMRSSSVNSIFYNPDVLYLPWILPDGSGRMPAGVYTQAYWNPAAPWLGTVDLSMNRWLRLPSVSGDPVWCPDSSSSHCRASGAPLLYDPGLFYVLKAGANPTLAASYAEFDLNTSAANTRFPAAATRVCAPVPGSGCCAASGCTLAQERQNFANWFVYDRTRAHLMKAAVSEALAPMVGTPGDYKLRVGYGTINSPLQDVDGVATPVIAQPIRQLDAAWLETILQGIQAITPYGGTPLRLATRTVGSYFKRDAIADPGSPWRTIPGTTRDGHVPLACRRSYQLLTTDGYYNDDPESFGAAGGNFADLADEEGNIDASNGPAYGSPGVASTDGSNPLGYSPNAYLAGHPYADAQANMLADYAMAQYVVDLQPSLDNRVPQDPLAGDLAYWQHLNLFTVGLGVTGQLDPAADLPGLSSGATPWDNDRIDDLWHAALDTHGQFFSARDVTSLTAGLNTALGSAAASARSEGGAATSTTALTTSTYKIVPSYSAGIWTGSLKAYQFDSTGHPRSTPAWDAASVLPAAEHRTLYTWTGSSASPANASVKFDTSLPVSLKNLVDPSPAAQDDLIRYVRGDQSREGLGAAAYRRRYGRLGDFTDSPPTFVKDTIDLGYDNLSGAPGYRSYLATKAARPAGVVFEGANDGMLHAFDGGTGVEVYGYVPHAVLSHLSNLARQAYGSPALFHQDFVDGPQVETDAFIPTRRSPEGWSDLVVGSFGAGAQGAYALDVTHLSSFDDKTLLWEIDGGPDGDPDVGYVFSRIATGVLPAEGSVGALTHGAWEAFIGNGADSANGNAVLLIVNLATGRIDRKVTMPTTGANGLMGVQLIRNLNKEVVGVYAGDLQGHLWRVDFVGADAPTIGFGGKPLFRAVDASGVAQPIVDAPAIYPRSIGNLVLFGTGRLIDVADADSTAPQAFYGIWDPTPAATTASAASPFEAAISGGTQRERLVEQTISTLPGGYFKVSDNAVDFGAKYGWYMDLAAVSAKQRVLYSPVVVGQWVLVNTMAPGGAPAPQSCEQSQGSSAYFLLPAETGAFAPNAPVWDVTGDGVVDSRDAISVDGNATQAAGYSIDSAGGDTTIVTVDSNTDINVTGDTQKAFSPFCLGECTIKKRSWRQLMTPPF